MLPNRERLRCWSHPEESTDQLRFLLVSPGCACGVWMYSTTQSGWVSANAVLSLLFLIPFSPSPPSSSLLCTVDDSDPGHSSEPWGERLVPPCRIYAGNRCSPRRLWAIPPFLPELQLLRCCHLRHIRTLHVCSFFFFFDPPASVPVPAHACVFSNRPTQIGWGGGVWTWGVLFVLGWL